MPSICKDDKENFQHFNPQNAYFYDAKVVNDSYSPIRKPAHNKKVPQRAVNQKSDKTTARISADRTNSRKCRKKINCSLMG